MPPLALTMSRYACTPLNASLYLPPSGLVTEATPPTRISVSETPGAVTGTFLPGIACVVGPPALGAVVVVGAASFFELPHATTAHSSTTVMARATGRRRGLLIG